MLQHSAPFRTLMNTPTKFTFYKITTSPSTTGLVIDVKLVLYTEVQDICNDLRMFIMESRDLPAQEVVDAVYEKLTTIHQELEELSK